MAADTHASEAGRALAAQRWAPETRLRAAVGLVIERSADLDDTQLAALRAIADKPEGTDHE
jgi:hypothetical protein